MTNSRYHKRRSMKSFLVDLGQTLDSAHQAYVKRCLGSCCGAGVVFALYTDVPTLKNSCDVGEEGNESVLVSIVEGQRDMTQQDFLKRVRSVTGLNGELIFEDLTGKRQDLPREIILYGISINRAKVYKCESPNKNIEVKK